MQKFDIRHHKILWLFSAPGLDWKRTKATLYKCPRPGCLVCTGVQLAALTSAQINRTHQANRPELVLTKPMVCESTINAEMGPIQDRSSVVTA